MLDIYQQETQAYAETLEKGILDMEAGKAADLEELMRAAHSVKGAARIIGMDVVAKLAHRLEDIFVHLQKNTGKALENSGLLLQLVDCIKTSATVTRSKIAKWLEDTQPKASALLKELDKPPQTSRIKEDPSPKGILSQAAPPPSPINTLPTLVPLKENVESFIRLDAKEVQQLIAMVVQALLEGQSLQECLPRLKAPDSRLAALEQLEELIANHALLLEKLHRHLLRSKLAPFSTLSVHFPRLVRDLAEDLSKKIDLHMKGEATLVDKDILKKLDTLLGHLLRNACDHGIEPPEKRSASGKPPVGNIRLNAYHHSGQLHIRISDDGKGIALEAIRKKAVEKGYCEPALAKRLKRQEIFHFLFLPGFSTKGAVSTVSGRGVGLDVVQTLLRDIGGSVSLDSEEGKGTTFQLRCPISRSVIRAMVVESGKQHYAFPLFRIKEVITFEQCHKVSKALPSHIQHQGQTYQLASLAKLLGFPPIAYQASSPLILFEDLTSNHYRAILAESILEEVNLTVLPTPAVLGPFPSLEGLALNSKGQLVFILDLQELSSVFDSLLKREDSVKKAPHLLVVDDSPTVLKLQERLLRREGYQITTAKNGREALEVLEKTPFDLLITDVDMPEMNGLSLTEAAREKELLKNLPILMISYKDSEEDRLKGLAAGANYYLGKEALRDKSFLRHVRKLLNTPLGKDACLPPS